MEKEKAPRLIRLPPPSLRGQLSVEEALARRRSRRRPSGEPLTQAQLSQFLWAAQGITEPHWGFRTAPSAGGLYPLELYLVAGQVEGLSPGIYHYLPGEHALEGIRQGDERYPLARAALKEPALSLAPASLVIGAYYERTAWKYGPRAERYVHLEAGHAGQNICLQAEALGLGTFPIAAFEDDQVSRVLGLGRDFQPLYIFPLGRALPEEG